MTEHTQSDTESLRQKLGDDYLLTRAETAEMLRVGISTLDAWIRTASRKRKRRPAAVITRPDGSESRIEPANVSVPHIRVGHRILFKLGDIKRFLAANTRQAA